MDVGSWNYSYFDKKNYQVNIDSNDYKPYKGKPTGDLSTIPTINYNWIEKNNLPQIEEKIRYRDIGLANHMWTANPLGFHVVSDEFGTDWFHTVARIIKYISPLMGLFTVWEGVSLFSTISSDKAYCHKVILKYYERKDNNPSDKKPQYVRLRFDRNVPIQIHEDSKKEMTARAIVLIVRGIFETFMLGWIFFPIDGLYEIVRAGVGPELNEIEILTEDIDSGFPTGGMVKNANSALPVGNESES